jgi:ceramide glucosyltransferase
VSFLEIARWIAALWWGAAIFALLGSFVAALLFPHLPWQGPETQPLRPVTAIVPLKHFNATFEGDQTSLFAQDYDGLDIILASVERQSEALDVVGRIRQHFPAVPSQLIHSDVTEAASPKLNNLWPAIAAAKNDLILTKDCNIRLAPGDLENLVHHHGPGVGLVSTISITTDPESFGAWIEASIINAYHARMLMLASALGLGVGCGKIMLFSRAALDRAGGVAGIAWAIGEDEAMQQAFEKIGLRTVLSDRTSRQILGVRSLGQVWQRQLRWMLIWRLQTPGVFVGDFLASALPVSLAAMLAALLAGVSAWTALGATLVFWFLLESLLCLLKGWPLSFWSLPAFIGREVVGLVVHVQALTTSQVSWGGQRHRVNKKAAP